MAMPRPLKMPILKLNDDRWIISIPARFSSTGKRQRLYFDSYAKAQECRSKTMQRIKVFGHQAMTLSPAVAESVLRCLDMLKPWNADLTDAVRFYVDHREREANAVSFRVLWETHVESREGHSDAYQTDLTRIGKRILPKLGKCNVGTITPAEIEEAMSKAFPTPRSFNNAFRTIRPAFTTAVRRGYRTDNPFDRIEKRRMPPKEISVMTIHQARAALQACCDHTSNADLPAWCRVDATDARATVAIMMFAGVRPREMTRLRWEDIRFDHQSIRIRGTVAKTRSARIIPMSDNLVAWLKETPEAKRKGPITPPFWKECNAAVRACAGVSEYPDIYRHTCASMHLAAHNDVNALREILGHETNEVLFTHYRAIVPKQDAVQFWGLVPPGSSRSEASILKSTSETMSISQERRTSFGSAS